jgi:hypothetical protein
LPEEAFSPGGECLSPNQLVAAIQGAVGNLIGMGPGSLPAGIEKTLAALAAGELPGPSDLDLTVFFALIFADPATQRPAIDETTGQESAPSFWDPFTGQGSITASPAERPKTYFVAGVCLDINTNPDPSAVAEALQSFLEATPGLTECLG